MSLPTVVGTCNVVLLYLAKTNFEIITREMSKNKSHYNKDHKDLARKLRKDGTKGEVILWSEVLRAKKFHGYQFNRQFCIDDYIVDFICRRLNLIIEIDGYSHKFKQKEDQLRDKTLAELGYTTIRFTEKGVRNDLNNVIRVLESYLPKNN